MAFMRSLAPQKPSLPRRTLPWLLLIAYLPSLTFVGHFSLDINIPGTAWYIGLPESPGHSAHNDGLAGVNGSAGHFHDHAEHCHIDLASCSDAPYAGSASFGLMGWVISFLGVATAAFLMLERWWRPSFALQDQPPVPPPRARLLLQ